MKRWVCVCLALLLTLSCVAASAGEVKVTKVEKGFGGDVSVTVTLDGDRIVSVDVTGGEETDGIGSKAIAALPARIVAAQSAAVDGLSGATVTSNAILSAVGQAIAEARGDAAVPAELHMTPGTYTASAPGFGGNVIATVTVTEDAIAEISLENEQVDNPFINYDVWTYVYPLSCTIESPQIFETVVDRLIPRIVDGQNIGVDAVAGATATSNAAKLAVADCVRQAGGADAVRALTKEIPASSEQLTYEADIVVVGGGTSGSTAAARAAAQGAKVVLIEKSARLGGQGSLSSGMMCFGSAHQREDGMDTEAAKSSTFNTWMSMTHYGSRAAIVKHFMDNTGETADFLVENGMPFAFSESGANYAVESVYNMDVADAFKKLGEQVVSAGGEILYETAGRELIVEDGQIKGVKAERYDGAQVEVYADTVIMATGGFGGDKEMSESLVGASYPMFSVTLDTGDGIRMMRSAGAALFHATAINSHILNVKGNPSGFDVFDQTIPFEILISYPVLKVNQYGERVTREDIGAVGTMQSLNNYFNAHGPYFYTIFTQEMADVMREKGLAGLGQTERSFVVEFQNVAFDSSMPMPGIQAVLDACVEQGLAVKADTVGELAERLGVPASALIETVADYNAACERGEDTLFGKNPAYLYPLDPAGPFYAIVGQSEIYGSLGGVDVNKHTQVLDANREVIPGLYAVGLDSIGVVFDGAGYNDVGGMTLGWSFTSGKIAADHAVGALGQAAG